MKHLIFFPSVASFFLTANFVFLRLSVLFAPLYVLNLLLLLQFIPFLLACVSLLHFVVFPFILTKNREEFPE